MGIFWHFPSDQLLTSSSLPIPLRIIYFSHIFWATTKTLVQWSTTHLPRCVTFSLCLEEYWPIRILESFARFSMFLFYTFSVWWWCPCRPCLSWTADKASSGSRFKRSLCRLIGKCLKITDISFSIRSEARYNQRNSGNYGVDNYRNGDRRNQAVRIGSWRRSV